MRWLLVSFLLLAGCWGEPRISETPSQEVPQSLGDFLQQWGIWLIPIGIIGLIAAAVIYRLAGKGPAQTIGIGAVAAIGTGAALYYIGPWVGLIFGASAVVVALAFAAVVVINRKRIAARLESETGLDIDGDGVVGDKPAEVHA